MLSCNRFLPVSHFKTIPEGIKSISVDNDLFVDLFGQFSHFLLHLITSDRYRRKEKQKIVSLIFEICSALNDTAPHFSYLLDAITCTLSQ